jgi:hypothetical protein
MNISPNQKQLVPPLEAYDSTVSRETPPYGFDNFYITIDEKMMIKNLRECVKTFYRPEHLKREMKLDINILIKELSKKLCSHLYFRTHSVQEIASSQLMSVISSKNQPEWKNKMESYKFDFIISFMKFERNDKKLEGFDYFEEAFKVISKSKNLIDMKIKEHFLKITDSLKVFFEYDKFYKYLSSLRTENDLHTFHECMLRIEQVAGINFQKYPSFRSHPISLFKNKFILERYMNTSLYWTPKHEELLLFYKYRQVIKYCSKHNEYSNITYQEFIDFDVDTPFDTPCACVACVHPTSLSPSSDEESDDNNDDSDDSDDNVIQCN